MINKDKLKRRFSRNAKTYDQYANVQKIMGDHLLNMVDDSSVQTILEVGSGTGYVTALIRRKYPDAKLIAVDIAEGMIKVAKERLKDDSVEFICGDIEEMELDLKFDLIISNATFQWFNNSEKTMQKLKNHLSDRGIICFSTFGNNTFKELHECYSILQDGVKPGQDFMKASEMETMLAGLFDSSSFIITEKHYTEEFDTCMSFFESIKKIGANNSQDNGTVKDPKFIYKVIEQYEKNYTINNKVQATYHSLFTKISMQS